MSHKRQYVNLVILAKGAFKVLSSYCNDESTEQQRHFGRPNASVSEVVVDDVLAAYLGSGLTYTLQRLYETSLTLGG
jgi:hypothetical protein